ncbi:MAG: serpin family protein [Bacilli bacterium]|nr:serpin family protein [Bacilli bacterium]
MKKINIIFIVICLLLLNACGFKPRMSTLHSTPGHLTNIKPVKQLNDQSMIKLNNFAFKLYDELYKEHENMFISPVSIYLALGMTYNGAGGNTALEMGKVLEADNISLEQFNKLNRDLQYLILGYEKSKIELANSIWIRDTYEQKVKVNFLNQNKTYYGAMVSGLDFNNPKAKDTINNWVQKNTKKRIKEAITGEIDPSTIMFLINTIYFKADWLNPFIANDTSEQEFHTPNGIKTVKMMNKIDKIGYTEDKLLKAVLLPYKDNKTSMFIILPNNEFNSINLNSNMISELIKQMKNNQVNVNLRMPKVKIEYDTLLKKPLMDLGMVDAWNGDADFSKMADDAIVDGIHIEDVTHKTFLAIDEKGTEAAAMTKVEMRLTSDRLVDYEMNINRPFILGVIDNDSEAILFLGNIMEP